MARKKAARIRGGQLNPQQELFCQYYARSGEFFGNGTLAYAEAYDYQLEKLSQFNGDIADDDPDENEFGIRAHTRTLSEYDRSYNVCAVEANRLLNNPKVQARLTVLLNDLLKDEIVDSQLAKLIMQDGDNTNKIAGIREYNKLRARIIDKSEVLHRLPIGETDLSVLIATLPQERQDYFYGIIRSVIEEAELLRSTRAAEGGSTR
jgi:hypothetical protein